MTDAAGIRTDARRNYDALLAAGQQVFRERGVEAPFEDVAIRAKVGKGTLYRHFPSREHLVAAILRRDFEGLAALAATMLGEEAADPFAQVEQWLTTFGTTPMRYPGIRPYVEEGMSGGPSALSQACAPMKDSFEALLDRAKVAGVVRTDVEASGLLSMLAAVPPVDPQSRNPYLELLLDGLATPE